jgi:chromosome segregation and condensation protein ScpB
MAGVEFDLSRVRADVAHLEAEVIATKDGVPNDVLARVREETAAAARVVAELEADARAKGIPLSVPGSRYTIYTTAPA